MRGSPKATDSDVSKSTRDITLWNRVQIQVCQKELQKELMTLKTEAGKLQNIFNEGDYKAEQKRKRCGFKTDWD